MALTDNSEQTMILIYVVGMYLAVGVLFALVFVVALIEKVDPGAVGSPWTFRVIIFPGCVVFWPVLLRKYLQRKREIR